MIYHITVWRRLPASTWVRTYAFEPWAQWLWAQFLALLDPEDQPFLSRAQSGATHGRFLRVSQSEMVGGHIVFFFGRRKRAHPDLDLSPLLPLLRVSCPCATGSL